MQPGRWRYLIFATLAIVALLLASCVPTVGESGLIEAPKVGALAPDFALERADGKLVRLSDFRGRKPVFLNFWATWCAPCQIEMPHMQKAWDAAGGRDKLEVLAVDLGESADRASDFLTRRGLTFTLLLDRDRSVALERYNILGLPTSFLIDRQGVIRYMKVGPFVSEEGVAEQIRAIINS
ncbi:MAG: TlpA family protein disulfide reductase [Chloroflexi bacterium]|nr:TlpA family protein disulfide reductase [Chloroflexota bacterium]